MRSDHSYSDLGFSGCSARRVSIPHHWFCHFGGVTSFGTCYDSFGNGDEISVHPIWQRHGLNPDKKALDNFLRRSILSFICFLLTFLIVLKILYIYITCFDKIDTPKLRQLWVSVLTAIFCKKMTFWCRVERYTNLWI